MGLKGGKRRNDKSVKARGTSKDSMQGAGHHRTFCRIRKKKGISGGGPDGNRRGKKQP